MAMIDSIERMLALRPARMVFGHYGLVNSAMEHLCIGRNQLLLWVQGVAVTAEVEESGREEAFFEWEEGMSVITTSSNWSRIFMPVSAYF